MADNPCPLTEELKHTLQCLGQHALCVGHPQQPVGQSFRCLQGAVLHLDAMKQDVGIAVVELIPFGEGCVLVGAVVDFVTQVPQHISHGFTPFQHIIHACEVGCEMGHVFPPCLPSEEGSADVVAEAGAWW